MKQAFWVAAAAVLEKEGTLPDQLLQGWHECVQESNNPEIIGKVLAAAFPAMKNLSLHELCNVAAILLDKSLNSAQDGMIGQPIEMLESLRLPVQTRPGLLIFTAETIKFWFTSREQQYQPHRAYTRVVEILLWLAEAATTVENQISSPAFTSFIDLLAQQPQQQQQDQKSILATLLHHFQTFPLGIKLQAMKLIGLCCQNPASTVLYACWPALEHILCSEKNEEVLHITACALFESIASHAATPTFSSSNTHKNPHSLHATAALENGLACPMPSIQFPAAVAAGKILLQQRQSLQQFWHEGLLERVATAADQAYRIQQDRVGAWGAWQPEEGGTTVSVLHVPPSRKLTAQHVLAVLEIVHNEHFPINRET